MNEAATFELSLDWDSAFDDVSSSSTVHADSIPDALILSLTNLGRVDIDYIINATGETYDSVISALNGSVFQNPETWNEDPYKGWETAEQYLSGNLRYKLRRARKANKLYPGRFVSNVYALRKLMPETVEANDIYITIGSPWIPTEVIEDFIAFIFKMKDRRGLSVKHDEYTGTWEIPNKYSYSCMSSVAARNTFGTARMDALEILERTLNMKSIVVYDQSRNPLARISKKRTINRGETVIAIEKQQKLLEAFQKWVWADTKRKELLESIFESKYGSVRRRVFDGSFLSFPGLSDKVQLYPYQKNAVARILFSPNTLLAHDVGSGKTYVMVAAGMELKRMGLSSKNLYVVPNNLVLQWKGIFETMYPNAHVMCVEPKHFTPDKRERTLASVRDNDWDAVIMAYSCFDRIPLSKSFLLNQLQDAKDRVKQIEEDHKRLTLGVKRRKEKLEKDIKDLLSEIDASERGICFDALGISRLFVDEAHNYKNVPIETKTDKVLGISAGGSSKCKGMMDKVRFIQKQNDGGGVIMATGTPITNSLTDVFVMQKYLQSGELAMLDIQTFDSWVGMFAERVTEFEVDVDTNSYRLATRFSKFHNLPELTALLSSIADFHQMDECADLPVFDGYSDSVIERGKPLAKYLKDISSRAEMVRGRMINSREDNMLKITTDGRKAALDLRLVDVNSGFCPESKVAKCAENVFAVYVRTYTQRSTQLVFCDTSTPKEGFNMYDELKRLLIGMGVKAEHIAFVHDATTEAQRTKLFAKVRQGEIRVLIGSTFKLGMGVNVQDRLIAIHHLDVPWRPADMIQREGRIIRQGNQNPKVYIYRYITEGSFDAYSWQLLETKQRFISQLLEGSLSDRNGSDVDSVVLNYAEVKALAVGNPLVKTRVELANELVRITALQHKEIESHILIEKELLEMPGKISRQEELTERCLADVRWYRANKSQLDKEERGEIRQRLADAISEHLSERREEDEVIMTYQGFDIVMPANTSEIKPHLWLCHEGKYYVELGDSSMGAIVRIDNYLDKLSEQYQRMRDQLAALKVKHTALEEESQKTDDYATQISNIKKKLEKIDKKLGVMQ